MGWVVNATPRPLYPWERDPVTIMGESQGRYELVRKMSPPTGIRMPDRTAPGKSLYRLSSPGPIYHPNNCLNR